MSNEMLGQTEVVRGGGAVSTSDRANAVDMVNHPPHHKVGGIDTIDFIRAKLGPAAFADYCRGNAIKYLARLGHKDNAAEDARKAEWYVARLAETLEGK